MAKLFKKTKSDVQQGTSKSNMLKKFGGKFKKAFSKKKQSPAQNSNEACVQDIQPATTVLPDSLAEEIEQPSPETRLGASPTHVGIDEGFQVSDNTSSQDLAVTGSRKPSIASLELMSENAKQATVLQESLESGPSTPQHSTESSGSSSSTPSPANVSNTDRRRIIRSSSLPSSPSSPTTAASSNTLYNTSRHSDTSSSSSLVKLRQAVNEHKGANKKCQQALAEYLDDEEKERENTEWVALVEWIKIGHQSDVVNLKKERSQERRRLEVRNRELRTMKREMRDLKESIEETTKDQEKIQQAPNSQSADDSDAESEDEDEGGVALAANNFAPIEEAENSRGIVSAKQEDAYRGRYTKKSRKETATDRREHQRALKQQLLEESAPDDSESQTVTQAVRPATVGESTSSTTQQGTISVNGDNEESVAQFKELQDHNRALKSNLKFTREVIGQLTSEAEAAEAEITQLRAENKFAQLEVGHCNAANACYRAAAEDADPARTAHIDGLLKRKDEIYAELEERAAECFEQLAEEKKHRAVEKVYSKAEIQGLKKELAHRFNVIEALTEGKKILKEQNDEVFLMFEGKILQDDIVKALLRDYEAIQKDNALLIKMINQPKCYIQDAEKQIAVLKADKIHDDHAADADRLKHRQTQQSLNGLMYINHQLNAKVEFQEEMREELKEELEGQIKHQADEIQKCLQWGADNWLLSRHQAQEAQIVFLNDEVNKANGIANQWRIRALEQQENFCPMINFPEIADWNAEDTRWRLRNAERENDRLQRVVRELVREGKKAEGKGKGKEADILEEEEEEEEEEHDGSNWLKDRAQAREEMEQWRWLE